MGDWHWILGLVLGSFGAFNASDPLIMIVDHTRALFNPLLCVLHLPERFSRLRWIGEAVEVRLLRNPWGLSKNRSG
jgi:hypothetical protein